MNIVARSFPCTVEVAVGVRLSMLWRKRKGKGKGKRRGEEERTRLGLVSLWRALQEEHERRRIQELTSRRVEESSKENLERKF